MNAHGATSPIDKCEQALNRLGELLDEPAEKNYLIDAIAQRFEFSYEMLWKALRYGVMQVEGVHPESPRQTFKYAYSYGWVDDQAFLDKLIYYRNLTTHTYNEAAAKELQHNIRDIHAQMRAILTIVRDKLAEL